MTATDLYTPRQTIFPVRFNAPKALVIEEHGGLAGLLGQLFARNGIETEVLGNGVEALVRLRDGDVDYGLVCSDVELPGASGWTVLEWVNAFNPELPIMLISGANEFGFVREAKRRGAAAAFCKPFSIAQIQQTVAGFFPYV